MVEKGKFYYVEFYNHLTLFCAYLVSNNAFNGYSLLSGNYEKCNFPVIYLSQDEEYIKNKRMTDFLNTGGVTLDFVVTDRVIEVLSDNNITGWKTYPVEVYDKNENYIGGYHGLTITGRCGAVKPSLAEPWIDSHGINTFKGMPLDLDTWDGSDIFLLQGTSYAFLTRRAKEIMKKSKFTNIEYSDIAEYIDLLCEGKLFWQRRSGVIVTR